MHLGIYVQIPKQHKLQCKLVMSLNVDGTVLNIDPAWKDKRAATLQARFAVSILLPGVTQASTYRIHLISTSELEFFLKASLNIFCVTWKIKSFPVLDLSLQNSYRNYFLLSHQDRRGGKDRILDSNFLGKDIFKPVSFDCKETTTNRRHVSS